MTEKERSEKTLLKQFSDINKKLIQIDQKFYSEEEKVKLEYFKAIIKKDSQQNILLKKMVMEKIITTEEIQQIKQYTYKQTIQAYINLTAHILELYVQENFKEGELLMKSLTLKMWKQKIVKLDKRQNKLMINQEIEKNLKVLDLNKYKIEWVGKLNPNSQKDCFLLKSIDKQNLYKEIILGSVDKQEAEDWYKVIQDSILNYQNQDQTLYRSSYKQLRTQSLSQNDYEQFKNNNQNGLITEIVEEEKYEVDPLQNKYQTEIINNNKTQEEPDVSIETSENQQIRSKRNTGSNHHRTKSQQINTFSTPDQKLPKNQNQFQSNSPQISNTQFFQQENQIQYNEEDKEIHSEEGYKLEQQINQLRILRNKENPNLLKIKLSHSTNTYKLLNVLNNFSMYQMWNPEVEKIEVLKKYSNQGVVLYQRNQSQGLLNYPREFIFWRIIKQEENKITMKDQSINYEEEFPNQNIRDKACQRGYIVRQNFYFYDNIDNSLENNNNLIIMEVEIQNKGFITKNQDQQMTLSYLKGFGQLEYFTLQQFNLQTNQILSDFNIKPNYQYTRQSSFIGINQSQLKNQNQNISNQTINLQKNQDSNQQTKNEESNLQQNSQIIQSNQPVQEQNFNKNNMEMLYSQDKQQQQKHQKHEIISELSFQDESFSQPIKNLQENQDIYLDEQRQIDCNYNLYGYIDESDSDGETQGNNVKHVNLKNKQKDDDEDEKYIYEYPPLKKLDEREIEKINEMINLTNNNYHWQICLNNAYPLQTIPVKHEIFYKSTKKYGHYSLFYDFKVDEKRGILEFIHEKKIKNQQKIMSYMFKTIGKNLIAGKSIISISLPVYIFEKRSNLERQAGKYLFAPKYLEKAGSFTDPVQQMKYVVTFAMTHLVLSMNMEKPFNPILGETFQGWINGTPVYIEQISHHPPICYFNMYGKSYKYYGADQTFANLKPNSVDAGQIGVHKVEILSTKNVISFHPSQLHLEGSVMGQRTFNKAGTLLAWDFKNNLFCEVIYNPDKTGFFSMKKQKTGEHCFKGGIYEINEQFKNNFDSKNLYSKKGEYLFKGLNFKKDVVTQVSQCHGIWHNQIIFDDEIVFDSNRDVPHALFYDKFPLPSDANFRQDLLYWRLEDEDKAQDTKEKLENIQRKDKKLRQTYYKKQKK